MLGWAWALPCGAADTVRLDAFDVSGTGLALPSVATGFATRPDTAAAWPVPLPATQAPGAREVAACSHVEEWPAGAAPGRTAAEDRLAEPVRGPPILGDPATNTTRPTLCVP